MVLAGRYRLLQRVGDVADGTAWGASTWAGVDDALDRDVEILVLDKDHPRADAVIDAGRRAALADDPRLERVLAVGRDRASGIAFVVTEYLPGRSLSELTRTGPLTPETARAVIADAAAALDRAQVRGLHHLVLEPVHVVVSDDGTVRVRGVGIEAALLGVCADGDAAARRDVIGLVWLLYCCLTGVWPPTTASPRALYYAVPKNLDALCSSVLGEEDGGPATPAALARELGGMSVGHLTVMSTWLAETTDGTGWSPDPEAPKVTVFPPDWESAADDEPLATFGPSIPLTRPAKEDSRVILAIVAGIVVLGLFFAVFGLRGLGRSASSLINVVETPVAESTQGVPDDGTASALPVIPEVVETAIAPATIAGVRPIDPEGDGEENDDRAPRAVDSDPRTSWSSKTYKTSDFGNLKSGLGLVLELEQQAGVSEVQVTVAGSGGTVELRQAVEQDEVEGSTLLATAPIEDGTVTLRPQAPVSAQRLILWFTTLPRVDGRYRVEVAEVVLR